MGRAPLGLPKLGLLSTVLFAVGCTGGPEGPTPVEIAALQEQFVLEVEPAGAVTPTEWRDAREPAATSDPADGAVDVLATVEADTKDDALVSGEPVPTRVVLVGRVGGMPSPFDASVENDFPFRAGQATFFLVDPATAAEFEAHADEKGADHAADCPFCAREAADKTDAIAVVSFAGPDGKPAPVDSRQLFDLKIGDLVVVRGDWSLEGDFLMVASDGLYVRR